MKPYATGRGWTLYHADCLGSIDALRAMTADAVVTDPPYGMSHNTDSTRFSGGQYKRGDGRPDWGAIAQDERPFDPSPWIAWPRVVLWGWNHYAAKLPVGTTLVWLKKADHLFGTFLSDAEVAWMKGGHGVYVYRKQFPPPSRMAENDGENVAHPCQKPIGLLQWCMERANVPCGGLVLDPFAGSASCGVACLRTGRRFIGVEIDERYCEVAARRLQRAEEDTALFAQAEAEHKQLELGDPS